MKNRRLLFVIGPFSLLVLSGCASASTKANLKQVNGIVQSQVAMDQSLVDPLNDTDIQTEIEILLKKSLTVDSAVKIAVLNNPSLKASLADLGISRADLMQAGLLHNPVFSAKFRKSNESDVKTNTEFEVKQDVMDLLFWPLRKRVANTQFKQAEYELAQKIVDFIQEVRAQFYEWQAAEDTLAIRRDFYTAQESDWELAQRQKSAGNINNLVLFEHQAAWQQAKIDLKRSEQETMEVRERLMNLLGLNSSQVEINNEEPLPEPANDQLALDDLEKKAIENRLDLAIKRQEIKTLEQSLTMARLGFVPSIEGGFNQEQETDGSRVKGPVVEAEVPVFDHKQADRLRIKSQIEKAQKELESMEAQARLEVRLAYGRLMTSWDVIATLKDEIPVRQHIIKETLAHYNYMLKGVYELLRAKQDEINTQHDYIMALRDYWISRSELEHAIGQAVPVVKSTTPSIQATVQPVSGMEHHHGGLQ